MSSSSSTAKLTANKLFNVEGQVALVTGGGTGIGLMCAQALAANGAKVYITGRRAEALEAAVKSHAPEGSGQIIPVTADITSKESIAKLRDEISSKEKYLNILVNNAGIAGPTNETEKAAESAEALAAELWKNEFDDWQKVYATNVTGYYFMSVAFLPMLSKATQSNHGHSGTIINISSISGILNSSQHHYAYNASKAATIQLTSLLGKDFSQPGVKVRVNSIAPGIFPSEMTAKESGDDQKSHIDAKGYREDKNIPAGRPGRDEDMAQAVLSLACNQYMQGQTVVVDGGYLMGNP